jgi:hypothetical protein
MNKMVVNNMNANEAMNFLIENSGVSFNDIICDFGPSDGDSYSEIEWDENYALYRVRWNANPE